jgi:uncharacterized membrane protein
MSGWATALVALAGVGSAVVAGALGAFSGFVMRALAGLPDVGGAVAMRSINRTAVRPPLMVAMFGTAVASVAAAVAVLRGPSAATVVVLTVTGGLLYLVGVIGVTVAANVPLNERLAAAEPGTGAADRFWAEYSRRWTRWNHLRSLAALTAAVAYVAALAT